MQIRNHFPEIRSSYSETNHTYFVALIPQRIIRRHNQFSDYIAEWTEKEITAKVTGQAVEENKNLSFFLVRARKDFCSTFFCGKIGKFSCYTKTKKGTQCFVQQEIVTSERKYLLCKGKFRTRLWICRIGSSHNFPTEHIMSDFVQWKLIKLIFSPITWLRESIYLFLVQPWKTQQQTLCWCQL